MGDVVASALVKDVLGRLTSVAIQEFGLLWGFKDDVLTLKDDFELIVAVLQDAEEKRNKERAVELWLKSLTYASLKMENVLDEVLVETMLQRLHKKRGLKYRVRAFFSSDHNQFMFHVRMAHKVKAIRRKLDTIASKRFELNLTPTTVTSHVDVGVAGEMPNRETSSFIHDSQLIFGRNEEMEMVTKRICTKDIEKRGNCEIRVYSIWGMGGVGKTTLAQLVYNHERVERYFELRCWVYVSENFQVKETMKKIIESIDKCGCTLTQLDTLHAALQDKLRSKRFLIVLDDVWIEEDEKAKWEELSKTLSCGAEGSIIVMTTRSNTTSQMMARIPELQHKLGCLSQEDSWLLFKKLAFAQGRDGGNISELEPIGWKIVEKCEGLPFAVKTLGRLMWSKSSTSDWQRVEDNNIWELQENKVLLAIKLSYDNLLPHLKRCFAYCCLFPKGYGMLKDEVIQLWVSNGLIPPRGEISLQVLGKETFNCLVWRSFFHVDESTYFDGVGRYKMHDMMHDIAWHVMKDNCLVVKRGKEGIIPNHVLHLSSSWHRFLFSPEDLGKLTSLRSIFMFGEHYVVHPAHISQIRQFFNNIYLRVLYMRGVWLETLPESICKLKYLKYLNLSYSHIKVLPESIIYLQNLQVMLLSYCHYLCKLPTRLGYMRNLQCLDINRCDLLLHLPLGIKGLTGIRILTWFPVGNNSGAKIGELGDLNLLEGELGISGLQYVRGLREAKNVNLQYKTNLMVLVLHWSARYILRTRERFEYDEEVLEGLEPNPCLEGLKIFDYMGKAISPSWMVKLGNLVDIGFFSCKQCEHISSLGSLPNLRIIKLRDMDSLKCFHDDEENIFLCLQELDIYGCQSLVSLPRNLPKLKVLKLQYCWELVSLPDEIQSFKDLNELVVDACRHLSERCEYEGEDWHRISHIPNISIDPSVF